MKSKRLLDIMGDIEEKDIESAYESVPKSHTGIFMKVGLSAACLAIIAAVGINGLTKSPEEITDTVNRSWETVYKDISSETNSLNEIGIIKKWSEMTDTEKYGELSFDGKTYVTVGTTVGEAKVGEKLGAYEMTGYDIYEDETHTASADVYAIDGISRECAVYVSFDQGKSFTAYMNFYYAPKTLGQFIEDLGSLDNIDFGTVYCDIADEEGKIHNVIYEDVKRSDVTDILLSDTGLQNVADDTKLYDGMKAGIAVDVPVLGYFGKSVWLTSDGYLHTNILETAKTFFIGKDAAKAFYEKLLCEYKGYEIIYVNNSDEIPESAGEEEGIIEQMTTVESKAVLPNEE